MTEEAHVKETFFTEEEKNKIIEAFKILVTKSHENARNKGWWSQPRSFAEQLALVHSEISEALEEFRNGKAIDDLYVSNLETDKPEGIPSEFADVIIRLCDSAGRYGMSLGEAIVIKSEYNAKRPQRHGNKLC